MKNDMYTPILKKIKYWQDYTGTGDAYRQEHDFDCILTQGNLFADTLFSLWLPLRYTLDYYGSELWDNWKEYEVEKLRPKKLGLKNCSDFLNSLIKNIDVFLPPTELTVLLSELFELGQHECNVLILPYRSWNRRRGCPPYWEYMPHFLYDLLNTESSVFLNAVSTWLQSQHLEMFFNGSIDKSNLKDLAGTGKVWKHKPNEINLEHPLVPAMEIQCSISVEGSFVRAVWFPHPILIAPETKTEYVLLANEANLELHSGGRFWCNEDMDFAYEIVLAEEIVEKCKDEVAQQLFNIPLSHFQDLLVPLTMLKTGILQSDTAIKYIKELRTKGVVDNLDYNLW